MKSSRRAALACIAASVILSACGGGGSGGGGALVRLVNATSAYPSLDLYNAATALTTGTTSYAVSAYSAIGAGTYTFNIDGTGTSAVLSSSTQTVTGNTHSALVSYVSNGSLQSALLGEDQAAPAAGIASLRFWDTAYSNVGMLDAYVVMTDCGALSTSSASPIVNGLTTTDSYVSMAAAAAGTPYHVCITGAGDKTDLRLDIPSATFTSGQVTTLILVNTTGGVLLNGLFLNQQDVAVPELNTSARVRLAVGATGGASVSAVVNGATLGSSLVTPAIGGYKLVTAGKLATSISFNSASAADPGFTIAAGSDQTLLVNGTITSTPVLISDDNSISGSTANPVKIRLVNGLNGTTSTASLSDDYVNVGDGASSGAATGYLQVPASAGLGRVEADYGTTQLCLSTGVTLTSGHVYSVFVLGDIPTTPAACNIRLDR